MDSKYEYVLRFTDKKLNWIDELCDTQKIYNVPEYNVILGVYTSSDKSKLIIFGRKGYAQNRVSSSSDWDSDIGIACLNANDGSVIWKGNATDTNPLILLCPDFGTCTNINGEDVLVVGCRGGGGGSGGVSYCLLTTPITLFSPSFYKFNLNCGNRVIRYIYPSATDNCVWIIFVEGYAIKYNCANNQIIKAMQFPASLWNCSDTENIYLQIDNNVIKIDDEGQVVSCRKLPLSSTNLINYYDKHLYISGIDVNNRYVLLQTDLQLNVTGMVLTSEPFGYNWNVGYNRLVKPSINDGKQVILNLNIYDLFKHSMRLADINFTVLRDIEDYKTITLDFDYYSLQDITDNVSITQVPLTIQGSDTDYIITNTQY